jgi:hypothetical protein
MLKFKGELNGTQVEEEIRMFGLKTKSSLGLDSCRIQVYIHKESESETGSESGIVS